MGLRQDGIVFVTKPTKRRLFHYKTNETTPFSLQNEAEAEADGGLLVGVLLEGGRRKDEEEGKYLLESSTPQMEVF